LTSPSGRTITFSGLMSRWTIPASCATLKALAICSTIALGFDIERSVVEQRSQRRR
jgi:hypothetical protein